MIKKNDFVKTNYSDRIYQVDIINGDRLYIVHPFTERWIKKNEVEKISKPNTTRMIEDGWVK